MTPEELMQAAKQGKVQFQKAPSEQQQIQQMIISQASRLYETNPTVQAKSVVHHEHFDNDSSRMLKKLSEDSLFKAACFAESIGLIYSAEAWLKDYDNKKKEARKSAEERIEQMKRMEELRRGRSV